jgi:hypothetical protein
MDGLALVVGIKYIVHHGHRIVYVDTHASISGPPQPAKLRTAFVIATKDARPNFLCKIRLNG